ncbi:hypothetical protein JVT61DRAFT_15273 [Boletus reticuloceps]|uniref:DUF6699 domain-containing protein n=1 Tax=Boletus reticuloceps TaxID=495285 RepID=A0A8I2YVM8_9AGAM|nr:hypothetical protein JVT61DRAFT_15273 [Boletus reticuloceps]
MQYHRVELNGLLTSSSTGTAHSRPVHLDWDIRHAPHRAVRVAGQVVLAHHLTQPATFPGVATLHVISDLLAEDWAITAHNSNGVTIDDILSATYTALHVPLTQSEWECMSPMQRARIEEVFYARCEASRDFDRARHGGVRRMDCLLHTTVFSGLSSLMYRGNRWEVVLTLSRDFGAHGRARSHPKGQRA